MVSGSQGDLTFTLLLGLVQGKDMKRPQKRIEKTPLELSRTLDYANPDSGVTCTCIPTQVGCFILKRIENVVEKRADSSWGYAQGNPSSGGTKGEDVVWTKCQRMAKPRMH